MFYWVYGFSSETTVIGLQVVISVLNLWLTREGQFTKLYTDVHDEAVNMINHYVNFVNFVKCKL